MTNRFGKIFTFTSWGESHGNKIGCVIDGAPAQIKLTESDIQYYLDQRRPGQKLTSPRNEADKVTIESGVFNGITTGAPISLIIENNNHQTKDYSDLKDVFRPGHADFTYYHKYGIWDYRGGGRASARETAMRVAAGAIARKILPNNIKIDTIIEQIGSLKAGNIDWEFAKNNIMRCPDKESLHSWQEYLEQIKESGDSVGAILQVRIQNVPIGLGSPVYNKLDANIASAIMSINAVKAVEIGDGFLLGKSYGSASNDQISIDDDKIRFHSNSSGGILGGISNGDDIIVRFAVKPTSSINKPQHTINTNYEAKTIQITGRHDPCVALRAAPVAEAMLACVLADHYLLNKNSKI
jgi:chorismate synthase